MRVNREMTKKSLRLQDVRMAKVSPNIDIQLSAIPQEISATAWGVLPRRGRRYNNDKHYKVSWDNFVSGITSAIFNFFDV